MIYHFIYFVTLIGIQVLIYFNSMCSINKLYACFITTYQYFLHVNYNLIFHVWKKKKIKNQYLVGNLYLLLKILCCCKISTMFCTMHFIKKPATYLEKMFFGVRFDCIYISFSQNSTGTVPLWSLVIQWQTNGLSQRRWFV